jgi:SOS-response transcriptional repressor LexA
MISYTIAAVTPHGADWERGRTLQPVALTPVQQRICDFVRSYQQMWGDTPLYREIAQACGLSSDSSVRYQIRRLVKLGLMHKPPRRVRAILVHAVPVKLT